MLYPGFLYQEKITIQDNINQLQQTFIKFFFKNFNINLFSNKHAVEDNKNQQNQRVI